jgi:hypothetical protein
VQSGNGDLLLNGGSPPIPAGPTPRTPRGVWQGFLDLEALLLRVQELRRRVETEIEAVPGEFKGAFKRSTLRLRAWPRRKGEPPYALYWITFPPKKEYYDDWMQRAIDKLTPRPRWFHRVKIRTSRDMDRAIHRAGLDYARKEVHAFHRRARSLNDAHKILTGALDVIRKMLESKAGGKGSPTPPPPPGYPRDLALVLGLVRRLEGTIRARQDDCRLLVKWARHKPRWQTFRLSFPKDAEHPFGRFLWVDDETGRGYGRLSYRERRELGLPSRVSRFIGPFEVQRRVLDRQLKASTALARRIRQRIPVALRQAEACLAAASAEPCWSPGMTYTPNNTNWRKEFGT